MCGVVLQLRWYVCTMCFNAVLYTLENSGAKVGALVEEVQQCVDIYQVHKTIGLSHSSLTTLLDVISTLV